MARGGIARTRLALACALLLTSPFLGGAAGLHTSMEDRWLAAHNRERAGLGLPPMRWNAALAGNAKTWAQHLAATNGFEHSTVDPGDDDPEGENLWAGTRGAYGPESMVGLWIAEKRHFRQGKFPDNSTTGKAVDIGHYTQLMWRASTDVGCAMATGANEDVLVCRYLEGGNVIGERPF